MIVFLFVIAAVVLAVFFYVITIQKTSQFGILKAMGTKMSYLAWSVVGQVMMLSVASLALSLLLTFGMNMGLPDAMPFQLDGQTMILTSLLFIGMSLLGEDWSMSAKLIMKQVTKTYGDGDGAMTVLNNLDLTVNEGEFVAVLGPSGSGKSTFLSAAGALLTPTSGEIFIDGESLNDKNKGDLTELRLQKIGFMFQSAQLLPFLKVE
ncbi:hypothetical protein KC345_g12024, partial [Hortaea werneckii]